ncbi:AraC family transcriptional regulator [Actibacterium lipolyticum]|uniref:Transposon Tn10 TetD protein n=1 Tax=Actibacterium lipolyticum TaxID=1524263 RepID=A0A238KRA4_9RHOB|nr:AraC family transcriptional regulator [Actibacterium lipolyticum]SMX45353.1 Transposon Tn10 TetD protein [Actibacterium lipolyticum]
MQSDYEKRMLRVLRYIHENPEGDLSLDVLADVAAMSRFHWHRVFTSMMGETAAQAVRRIRLFRASCLLVQTEDTIAEIAAKSGYQNVTSFTRAFSEKFNLSPAAFRQRGDFLPLSSPHPGERPMFDIVISNAPARRIAAISHTGPYYEIGRAYGEIAAIFSAKEFWSHTEHMIAIFHDDVDAVPLDQLRSHAGFIVDDTPLPDGVEELRQHPGRAAVINFKGPYAGLKAAYEYLYGQWLPRSGEEPADAPSYEIYLNSPMDTAPDDLLTDIYVPLRG